MTNESKYYYQVLLEIAIPKDQLVLGFINISHIPYSKFEEVLKDKITEDQRFLFEDTGGYIIDEALYEKHKDFWDKEVSFKFRFDLFQYSVELVSIKKERYTKDYYEELPPFFKKG